MMDQDQRDMAGPERCDLVRRECPWCGNAVRSNEYGGACANCGCREPEGLNALPRLLHYDKVLPPDCQGWETSAGRREPCPLAKKGTNECPLCHRLTKQSRELRRRADDASVQRKTYGPASEGVDVFAGFREEEL